MTANPGVTPETWQSVEVELAGGLTKLITERGGSFDVLTLTAGKRGDAGTANLAGDLADRVGVSLAGDRETGFDDVDAKGGKLMSHSKLFFIVHGAAGGLLAVAEGGIEEDDLIRGHRVCHFRSGRYHNACL